MSFWSMWAIVFQLEYRTGVYKISVRLDNDPLNMYRSIRIGSIGRFSSPNEHFHFLSPTRPQWPHIMLIASATATGTVTVSVSIYTVHPTVSVSIYTVYP